MHPNDQRARIEYQCCLHGMQSQNQSKVRFTAVKRDTYGNQEVGMQESVKVKGLVANVVDTKLGLDRL